MTDEQINALRADIYEVTKSVKKVHGLMVLWLMLAIVSGLFGAFAYVMDYGK